MKKIMIMQISKLFLNLFFCPLDNGNGGRTTVVEVTVSNSSELVFKQDMGIKSIWQGKIDKCSKWSLGQLKN